ncbi:MAG: TonB-dependent receptor [Flavobacteriaceae bacterium]|nr:TonB-dependent receptor [Flavobacteriaceae bacterium]
MKYFFLLFPFIISAQLTNISGFVKSESGNLGYASVSLLNSQNGVIANDDGYFEIDIDLSKHNDLLISYIGHVSKKISLKKNNLNFNNIIVFLDEDINGLNEIVVTGTLKDEYVTESPVKVNVLTAKKINSFLPSAGTNLTKIIQLVNGAQEVVACGVCYTNSISINGLEGPYTSVLMDGIPMYGNLASIYGLNGIPNMVIDRLEIVKGPSSTLYGSEAVAGVINIITKDPENQPLLSLDIQGTSHNESFINMALTPKIGKTTGYFGVNWDRKNHYDDFNNDGFGDDINLDRISVFNKWNIHRKSNKQFTISSRYYFEDRRNGVEEFLKNRNYKDLRGSENIYGESIYTYRFELFGKYEFDLIEDFEVNYSYSTHNQNSYYGSDYYVANQDIFFSQFTLNKKYKKHDFLYGLSIKNNLYDDNTIATEKVVNGEIRNKASNQFVPGLLVQDQFKPSEKISLIGGLRLDHFKDHGLIFAPSFHIKYNPGEWLAFRLNAGTGFRLINLFTEDHAFVTGQREVKILEELQPEKSKSLILNTNYIYSGFNGSGNLDIDLFYTYFSNKIIPNYDNPKYIIYQNLEGYSYSKGFSGAWNHSFLNGTAFTLNFNHQIVKYSEYNNNIKTLLDMEHSPRWTAGLNFKFPINKSWFINTSSNYVGVMQLPEVFDMNINGQISEIARPSKSEPFSLHNININGKLTNKNEVYFGVLNIFNFRQKESPLVAYNDPNYNKGFSPFFDTSYAYAPNQGINVFVGYKFNLTN